MRNVPQVRVVVAESAEQLSACNPQRSREPRTVHGRALVRATVITILGITACGHDRAPGDRNNPPAPGKPAAVDPWSAPRPDRPVTAPSPPPRKPPRPLSMDGKIEGATPSMLATPLSGYANAKVGDWRAFTHVTTNGEHVFHATAIAVVTAVTPTTVTIELSGRLAETGEQRSDGEDVFPRAFTVDHEIHRHHGDWTASAVEVTDDKRTIDGRSFPCKRIAFASLDPLLPGKSVQVEVWLSPEVPAGGEVAVREVQKAPAYTITSVSDLIGFGDATKTMWGARPTGL